MDVIDVWTTKCINALGDRPGDGQKEKKNGSKNKKDAIMVIVYAILLPEQMRSIASPEVRPGWW